MVCLKNIREVDNVGDLSYDIVRPILLRIDNAQQLRRIELNSPQLEGETTEIWLKLIERYFPMEAKAKAYKPSNPKKWYRVWDKYKKDHDQALEESEKQLKNALMGLREDKEKNTSRIVIQKALPRSIRVGPKRAWGGGGWGQKDGTGSTLTFNKGSRTKTANGASVMRKVRREVKEIASIHGALSRPTPRGSSSLTKLRKAPVGMVNDRRLASQPVYRPVPKVSEKPAAVTEYEERATFLSDSEEDDDNNDLFDDEEEEEEEDDYDEPAAPSPARNTVSRPFSSSLLKRPAPSPASGIAKRPATSTTRRSGLLSNSYKGAASKPQTKPINSTTSISSRPPPTSESSRSDPTRSSSYVPSRTQTSPRPRQASPPPAQASSAAMDAQPRKRKSVNIFMSRKKRA